MAKVKFVLKEPKADQETLVYLMFTFNNLRLKYSTGDKIHPDFWNPTTKRAKETKYFPEYPEFNTSLDNLENKVKTIYRRLVNDDIIPNVDRLREELDKEKNDKRPDKKITLLKFIELYIEESKVLKSANTIKSYNTSQKHFKEYIDNLGKGLDFEDIDLEFYNKYLGFLTILNLSQNSIGKEVKNLKVFLNEATERGINNRMDFKRKKFKKPTEDNDKIYLTQQDIDTIYKLDLSKKKAHEKARDLFVIGCCTGLRFSDFSMINKENIFDGNKLKIRTQKTGEVVIIPMHKYVKEIIEKYNNELPRLISNQKLNDYLKDIGEEAEIKETFETSITKGGKLVKDIKMKYELISSHTARRSFATNLFIADVPSITIMKITGHRTEKSFLRYIRISQEENANKLLNHPFFK